MSAPITEAVTGCDCLKFWSSHHPECPTLRTRPEPANEADISLEAVELAAVGAENNGQRWLAEMLRELSRSLTACEKRLADYERRDSEALNSGDGSYQP